MSIVRLKMEWEMCEFEASIGPGYVDYSYECDLYADEDSIDLADLEGSEFNFKAPCTAICLDDGLPF